MREVQSKGWQSPQQTFGIVNRHDPDSRINNIQIALPSRTNTCQTEGPLTPLPCGRAVPLLLNDLVSFLPLAADRNGVSYSTVTDECWLDDEPIRLTAKRLRPSRASLKRLRSFRFPHRIGQVPYEFILQPEFYHAQSLDLSLVLGCGSLTIRDRVAYLSGQVAALFVLSSC